MPHAPSIHPLVSFLEHERAPVAVIAPDHTLLAVNTAYRRQFGVADRDCIGRKCYEVSHGLDAPCDELGQVCPMHQCASTRAPETALHARASHDRISAALEIEVRPVLDATNAVHVFVERLSPVEPREGGRLTPLPVGQGPAFSRAMASVRRVAPSMLPVLLLGESGTGKELFARAVHDSSPRRRGPFVVVDCSGLTDTLFESELFGYEKGAFTGALARKTGLVEAAQGGTLFLDEIGDVPLSMQVKLLRLIETGTFRRVGGIDQLHADFRLVCATHQPLVERVAEHRFRQDLYFRISAFPVRLPALRERLEDLPQIAHALLRRSRGGPARADTPVTTEAMRLLAAHDWPGNVRELRNVLDRAALYAAGAPIDVSHLVQCGFAEGRDRPPSSRDRPLFADSRSGSIEEFARQKSARGESPPTAIASDDWREIARAWPGSRIDLARHLGWSERTLYRRLRAAGLARAFQRQAE
jgi:DNA-binding NtrC family response regulator